MVDYLDAREEKHNTDQEAAIECRIQTQAYPERRRDPKRRLKYDKRDCDTGFQKIKQKLIWDMSQFPPKLGTREYKQRPYKED